MTLPRRLFAGVVGLCVAFTFAAPAYAGGSGDLADLKAEIAALKGQLKQMEARLAAQESATYAAKPGDNLVLPATAGEGTLPAVLSDVTMSGYVSASYVYNFDTPNDRTTSLRSFNTTEANGFKFNAFNLALEKPVSEESRVGFAASLIVGDIAEGIGSAGLGSTSDELDLRLGYIEALLPVLGKDINVKVGKLPTLIGAETIETTANWNFSHSYQFGFSEPFNHVGARFSAPVNDWLSATVGVNNGWDVADDNNTAKTVEWSLGIEPVDANYWFSLTGIHGAEQARDNHDYRHLFGLLAGYDPCDKLSLMLSAEYATEEDGVTENVEDASWWGVAGYAKYQWCDKMSTALRAEYFSDEDGVRTGVRTSNATNELGLWSLTLTQEFQVYKDLITRVEYRHDFANGSVFEDGSSTDNNQDTIALELIYPF